MPDRPPHQDAPDIAPASSPEAARLLADVGEDVEAAGNRPFRLDSQQGAWWVRDGKVEVFAQPEAPGLSDGPRTHVATIGAGGLLLSLGVDRTPGHGPSGDGGGSPIGLLAVGHPDTRLSRLSIGALMELARQPEAAPVLVRLLEGWLRELPRELLRDRRPPKQFQALEPGREIRLTEERHAARAHKGVAWVRHLEGSSRYLGREELVIEPEDVLLPLSEETWLISAAGTRISCVESSFLLRSGGLWSGLDRYHRLFLDLVRLVLEETETSEREQLQRKVELDLRTLEAAHTRLGSVLESAERREVEIDQGADLLFAACRRVGEAAGIRFEKPPAGDGELPVRHHLRRIAAASRVRHRRVVLRDDWWRRDNGPLLGFRSRDEGEAARAPVALLPVSARGYELLDPRDGSRTAIDGPVAERLEGEAVMFYPPLPERPLRLRDLAAAALRGSRRDLRTLLAMGILGGLLALLVPLLTGHLFGNVIPASDRSQLLQVTLALVVGALAGAGFHVTRSIAVLRMSGKIDGSLQAAVWDRLMALPVPFFRGYSVGDLADRVMGVDAIRELLTGHVATSLLGAVFSVFSFALLFYFSGPLALVATGLVAVLALAVLLFSYFQLRHQREMSERRGKVASLLFGLIHGIAKIRVAGAEHRAYGLWAEGFSRQRRSAIAARRIANLQGGWNAAYGVVTTMGLFAMVAISQRASLPASTFLAFLAAFGQFQSAALSVIGLIPRLLATVPTYERLRPILQAVPETDPTKTPVADLRGELEFSHVSFRYRADGPQILDEVSFHARPGEFIALVGPSGAGKSTCLRLILGFESPDAGSIYFDGQDLPSLDLASLRAQIGVVLQGSKPAAGTLFTNIVGSRNLTVEDAWEALRMTGLEEDVKALPMGLHTVVSEDASTFSGGQLQRILIARAIVHRPRILLFDEATSALDNPTQEHVTQSLDRLKATRVVVAHRLSTVRNADRIYAMQRGAVVESGGFEELMAQRGVFWQLARRQLQ